MADTDTALTFSPYSKSAYMLSLRQVVLVCTILVMVTKAAPRPKDIHIHLHGLGKMADTDTGSEGGNPYTQNRAPSPRREKWNTKILKCNKKKCAAQGGFCEDGPRSSCLIG